MELQRKRNCETGFSGLSSTICYNVWNLKGENISCAKTTIKRIKA
jgi:hypothetical protein